jgi:hypothetical protein
MQGPVLVDLVLPAAWNHARALMPSQSRHRGPSVLPVMTAVRCGIGEGAESGAGRCDPRASCVGARRTANQCKQAGGCWRIMRPGSGLPPEVFASLWPLKLISS